MTGREEEDVVLNDTLLFEFALFTERKTLLQVPTTLSQCSILSHWLRKTQDRKEGSEL